MAREMGSDKDMQETWNEIKRKKEYSFLNEGCLGQNICYAVISGSKAYGTDIATSDTDIRGVFMDSTDTLLGLSESDDCIVERNTDTVMYGLRKFIGLAARCNPNIIEMLGTEDQDILYMNEYGKLLRSNAELFLSKQAYNTFAGYANSQLRRLENALARDKYPQPEKEKHILGSLQAEMLEARSVFGADCSFNLYIDESQREDMETEIYLDAELKHISLRDYIRINGEFSNMLRNYAKLNKRNHKKDLPHLRKHAMHLIRLYYTGIDILKNGVICTKRRDEHDILMGIRSGAISIDEVFKLQKELESVMEKAYAASHLPEGPDMLAVHKLLKTINLRFLGIEKQG